MTRMNTLGSMGLSDYQSRTVTIDVTGVCQQSVLKTGNYLIRVPYSQMSQTMKRINRQGGKVVSIQLMGNAPAVASESAESAEFWCKLMQIVMIPLTVLTFMSFWSF